MPEPIFSLNNQKLQLIAGPCALESEAQAIMVVEHLLSLSTKYNFDLVFKASFDKANRNHHKSARGVGLEQGLEIFKKLKRDYKVRLLTDVHAVCQVDQVAQVVDVLQIPAFLCRQIDLLEACAKSGRTVNVKKGQFLSPHQMLAVVERLKEYDCQEIWVCERGSFFGYNDLVVDMRSLIWLQEAKVPVIYDASHSVQLPGAGFCHDNGKQTTTSGGNCAMALPLARAAIAVGVSGLFIETHPDPSKAISDRDSQIKLVDMDNFIREIMVIHNAVKPNDDKPN